MNVVDYWKQEMDNLRKNHPRHPHHKYNSECPKCFEIFALNCQITGAIIALSQQDAQAP